MVLRLVNDLMSTAQQEKKLARRKKIQYGGTSFPERLWVVLDEAHTLAPSDGRTAATAPIVDYVKRGRDAGLSLIFATQQPAAADSRLMSQVDLTISHALSFESDLQAAVARMPTRTSVEYQRGGFTLGSLGDAIRSLAPGECFIADASSGRIFSAQVRPRLTAHGGHTPPPTES